MVTSTRSFSFVKVEMFVTEIKVGTQKNYVSLRSMNLCLSNHTTHSFLDTFSAFEKWSNFQVDISFDFKDLKVTLFFRINTRRNIKTRLKTMCNK